MTLKHLLKHFSKTEVQEDKTHPNHLSQTILNRLFGRVLEREGVKVSCAKHTEKNLFTYLPIHLFIFKKAAFTLAEVLITFGIIGVVAALTLPTLIQNYKKQTYVNQLKKVVNTLENTAQMALAQEGVSAVKDTTLYCNLVNPYDCEYYSWENDNWVNDPIREEVINKYFRTIEYNGNYSNGIIKIVLPDGAVIVMGHSLSGNYPNYGMFTVDVNGYKSPNEEGRDIFVLGMTDKGKVIDCAYLSGFPAGGSVDSVCTCNTFAEEQYLENGCFYQKIVSDGWKMNY